MATLLEYCWISTKISLCEKCPNMDHKKLRIWTLFTQCLDFTPVISFYTNIVENWLYYWKNGFTTGQLRCASQKTYYDSLLKVKKKELLIVILSLEKLYTGNILVIFLYTAFRPVVIHRDYLRKSKSKPNDQYHRRVIFSESGEGDG